MNPRDESRFRELGVVLPLSPAANRIYTLLQDAGGMTDASYVIFPVLVSLQEQLDELQPKTVVVKGNKKK